MGSLDISRRSSKGKDETNPCQMKKDVEGQLYIVQKFMMNQRKEVLLIKMTEFANKNRIFFAHLYSELRTTCIVEELEGC